MLNQIEQVDMDDNSLTRLLREHGINGSKHEIVLLDARSRQLLHLQGLLSLTLADVKAVTQIETM